MPDRPVTLPRLNASHLGRYARTVHSCDLTWAQYERLRRDVRFVVRRRGSSGSVLLHIAAMVDREVSSA